MMDIVNKFAVSVKQLVHGTKHRMNKRGKREFKCDAAQYFKMEETAQMICVESVITGLIEAQVTHGLAARPAALAFSALGLNCTLAFN